MPSDIKSPLEGKKILVTRAKHQSLQLVGAIEDAGGFAVCFPMVEIQPPDSWSECDEAIRRLPTYDFIVFTSSNAVGKFFERTLIVDGHNLAVIREKPVYAVGDTTKRSLESHGCRVNDIPEKSTAGELGHLLLELDLRRKKILFPRGNLGSQAMIGLLRSSGAEIDDPIVYKTGKPDGTNLAPLKEMLLHGEIDAVTFFSPSSVKNFVELISAEILRTVAIAVIGEVTAKAAEELGMNVDVISKDPSVESMVKSLRDYFASVQGEGSQ